MSTTCKKWIDYTIDQLGDSFKIQGDTPTEVMDKGLYKPGDMYIVDDSGWFIKTCKFQEFMKHGDGTSISD
tara:strand:- start:782 stop:994 length:213 start_codon:yes stop_codon:yes gene_type:complete